MNCQESSVDPIYLRPNPIRGIKRVGRPGNEVDMITGESYAHDST